MEPLSTPYVTRTRTVRRLQQRRPMSSRVSSRPITVSASPARGQRRGPRGRLRRPTASRVEKKLDTRGHPSYVCVESRKGRKAVRALLGPTAAGWGREFLTLFAMLAPTRRTPTSDWNAGKRGAPRVEDQPLHRVRQGATGYHRAVALAAPGRVQAAGNTFDGAASGAGFVAVAPGGRGVAARGIILARRVTSLELRGAHPVERRESQKRLRY